MYKVIELISGKVGFESDICFFVKFVVLVCKLLLFICIIVI